MRTNAFEIFQGEIISRKPCDCLKHVVSVYGKVRKTEGRAAKQQLERPVRTLKSHAVCFLKEGLAVECHRPGMGQRPFPATCMGVSHMGPRAGRLPARQLTATSFCPWKEASENARERIT